MKEMIPMMHPHRKKAVAALLLCLLLLFLCACESGNGNYQKNLTVNCISNRTDTGFSSRLSAARAVMTICLSDRSRGEAKSSSAPSCCTARVISSRS